MLKNKLYIFQYDFYKQNNFLWFITISEEYPEHEKVDRKQVFETASRYHFIHTLAMLGLPLCRSPYVVCSIFVKY